MYTTQKGERSERFAALHNRLIVSGDLDQDLHNREDLFDDVLERALQKFQKRHGLTVNGIVDQDTLE
ncbi:MAG: peptidoglycan-binding protein, partial [Deltaproteobacteria bacterium]|nr:peptidoglycan-binding protein [Deltaproteobacteria bacterium]